MTLKYNHFDSIATQFNSLWRFSDGYKSWMTDNIIRYLALKQDDVFVDLGGGTGLYTQMVAQKAELLNKALCVEPSSQMLSEIKDSTFIAPLCLDAVSFSVANYSYDKILLKEMIHFITDIKALFENISKQLKPNGIALIVTRPQITTLPFFQKAKDEFAKTQPSIQTLIAQLGVANLQISIDYQSFNFKLQRNEWHNMLQARFMSNLQNLSDSEIKDGICEIDFDDVIDIKDEVIFITLKNTML